MEMREQMKKHLNNRTKKRIIAALMALTMGIGIAPDAYASAVSNAQNKKNQAQSDLDSVNHNISNIEQQKSSLQTEIDSLDAELVGIITNMNILEGELDDKEKQLEQVNKDLKKAEKKEKTQYENMKKRIRYLYENGDTNYLDIILGASDFADFLNRVEYSQQVYDYDRNLLTNYQETVQQVADLKQQVEGEKAELEEMQASYQEQKTEYEGMLATKKQSMSDFDSKLSEAKQLASRYQSVIEEQNQIIAEEQRKQEEARKAEEQRKQEEAKKQQAAASNNQNTSNGQNTADSGKTDSGSSSGGGKNPAPTTGVSGSSVVSYACQFIGNPYVSGGTSLTNGCDCSGFVMSVYANFGISLPHSSYALQSCGQEVSYENARAGDLICYAGHVAIYMGNGQIVNASSSAPYPIGGIKTNTATYRSILTVRRVI